MADYTPMTTAERIEQAKRELDSYGGGPEFATAHALIAIAELMATNINNVIMDATARGAVAAAESLGSILSVLTPGSMRWPDNGQPTE